MTAPQAGEAETADKLTMLRRQLAAITAKKRSESVVPQRQQSPVATVEEQLVGREILAVPQALSPLLPHGGLARGTVTAVKGATSMLLAIIAEVSASGGQVAVIGQPQLCLLAAADMGADLSRIAIIPDPGMDPVEIAAVLLDGMDLVVLGLAGATVPPSRSRVVMARARNKGAALVVADGEWSGTHLTVQARVSAYRHLPLRRRGYGRVGGYSLDVRIGGRGFGGANGRFDVGYSDGRVQFAATAEVLELAQ